MNHDYDEEAMSKQREAIANLEKEIQNQNQKFIDMEHKHSEKNVIARKLIVELLERQRSLLEMENKYNDSLNMIMKLTGEGDTTHEECRKELQLLKIVNSNINGDLESIKTKHEELSKELKEIKTLNDLQKTNFGEAMQKNMVKLSSLQFAAVKQENDYKNLLNVAENLKKQNEQLNAKIIHLEQENQTIKKGKLDGLEEHQFKKVNFYKSLAFEGKKTMKQELELYKRAHTPKLKVEGNKGIEDKDQEEEDTEEEDQDGEENREVEEEENQEDQEEEDEKLVWKISEDTKLEQENEMIGKGKLDDWEGHKFKEVHFDNSISFEKEWVMKQEIELHKGHQFKEIHFDNSISFEEWTMKQKVEHHKLTHAFDKEHQEEGDDDADDNDNNEDDEDNNDGDEDGYRHEDHNDDYDLEIHQFKETHFYNSVIFEEERTMRQEVKLDKITHAFEQERQKENEDDDNKEDDDKDDIEEDDDKDDIEEDDEDADHNTENDEYNNDEEEGDNYHEDHYDNCDNEDDNYSYDNDDNGRSNDYDSYSYY